MAEEGAICEYCHMPKAYSALSFEQDHIVAQQHGGTDDPSNRATSCVRCNKHKGPNIAGLDPATGKLTRLFHPRQDAWEAHFKWQGAELVGLTAVGRATIAVLDINHPLPLMMRAQLMTEGVFPL